MHTSHFKVIADTRVSEYVFLVVMKQRSDDRSSLWDANTVGIDTLVLPSLFPRVIRNHISTRIFREEMKNCRYTCTGWHKVPVSPLHTLDAD